MTAHPRRAHARRSLHGPRATCSCTSIRSGSRFQPPPHRHTHARLELRSPNATPKNVLKLHMRAHSSSGSPGGRMTAGAMPKSKYGPKRGSLLRELVESLEAIEGLCSESSAERVMAASGRLPPSVLLMAEERSASRLAATILATLSRGALAPEFATPGEHETINCHGRSSSAGAGWSMRRTRKYSGATFSLRETLPCAHGGRGKNKRAEANGEACTKRGRGVHAPCSFVRRTRDRGRR